MKRQTLMLVLRLGLSGGLLYVLLTKIDSQWSQALPPLTASTIGWLIGAFLLTLAGVVLSALRWGAVLEALGQHPRAAAAVALPRRPVHGERAASTIGGDALRVSRLRRDNGESPTTLRLGGARAADRLARAAGASRSSRLAVNPGLRQLGPGHGGRLRRRRRHARCCSSWCWSSPPGPAGPRGHARATTRAGAGSPAPCASASASSCTIRRAAARVLATGFAYQLVLVVSALMAARALGIPPGSAPPRCSRSCRRC